MKKTLIIIFSSIFALVIFFRIFCGIFVIQPIGALPKGTTIVYWRTGTNMPFISSADGLLLESGSEVSLLGRGLMLGSLSETIKSKEIFRMGYSERLYLWSTGGKKYEE